METKNYLFRKAEKLSLVVFMFFMSILSIAQETGDTEVTTTSTTTTTEEWYANPLYLVLGAVVLIIIIALIARSGRRS